jgi:ketosteroid isomerase-like protein
VDDTQSLIAELAARVRRLEDEREILRGLTRYGVAVDVGDADAVAGLYAEDTVIDLGPTSEFEGVDGARQLVLDERHQAIVGRCAHTMGPFVIDAVDGDHARATGYVRVYVSDAETGTPALWRLSVTSIELRRTGATWLISRRLSRAVGTPDGTDVLDTGL